MKVKDIMTASPSFLLESATIQEAAQNMQQLDCGFLPVGQNDKITGVVTDRDIALRAVAQGLPPTAKVSQIASKKVLYCFEGDTLDSIAENMAQNQVRRLIVLSNKKDKRLAGVVSVADIALAKNAPQATLTQLLKGVSQSSRRSSSKAA